MQLQHKGERDERLSGSAETQEEDGRRGCSAGWGGVGG